MNDDEILHWIDIQQESIIQDLISWAAINSHVFNLEGQQCQRNAIIQKLQLLDAQIEEKELPPYLHMSDIGIADYVPVGNAIVCSKRPQAPRQIIISGHLDTVYPQDSAFQKAHIISSDLIGGPGVADMKGGLLVAILALSAFEKTQEAASVGWKLVINPDEEIGSPSSESLLTAIAREAHVALVFEPAFPDGAFVFKRAGSLNLAIVTRGIAAHAGRDFFTGRSAILAMASLLHSIQNIHLNGSATINVGTFHGGHAYNIVPDLAICKVNIRAESSHELHQAHDMLLQMVQSHRHLEGITFTVHEISCREPMAELNASLLNTLQECANRLQIEVKTRLSRGVSDANIFSQAGIPTIDTLGPIGFHLHTENEAVLVPSLLERAKLGFLLLKKLSTK